MKIVGCVLGKLAFEVPAFLIVHYQQLHTVAALNTPPTVWENFEFALCQRRLPLSLQGLQLAKQRQEFILAEDLIARQELTNVILVPNQSLLEIGSPSAWPRQDSGMELYKTLHHREVQSRYSQPKQFVLPLSAA